MEQPTPPPGKSLPQMEIPEDLNPTYANVVRITHSPAEMVLDFALLLPGEPNSKIQSRVVMSPMSAKLFYRALGENLAKYEANFGEIKLPGGGTTLADHLFRPQQK